MEILPLFLAWTLFLGVNRQLKRPILSLKLKNLYSFTQMYCKKMLSKRVSFLTRGQFRGLERTREILSLPPDENNTLCLLTRFLGQSSCSCPGPPESPVSQLSSRGKQEELASSSSSSSLASIAPSSAFLPAGWSLSAARWLGCGESQPLTGAGSSQRSGPTEGREQEHNLHTFQLLSARSSCLPSFPR